MVYAIIACIICGVLSGYFMFDITAKDTLDFVLLRALSVLVLIAGIEIGSNRDTVKKLYNPKSIMLAISIPTGIIIGTVLGSIIATYFIDISIADSMVVGIGLGWYSLSSVVISTMYSTEIGTIAFFVNMLRETFAFLLIPFLVRWNKYLAIAPAGAPAMDTLLPLTIRYTNLHVGMYGFASGLILTLVVPILLTVFMPS
jgi:uncharacterized membrane protein YbjE (DUF340 family)